MKKGVKWLGFQIRTQRHFYDITIEEVLKIELSKAQAAYSTVSAIIFAVQ